jgi:hypothetical protein
VDNLPVSTTVEGLKGDLKKIIGTELDYEKFEVKGISARLWTTAIVNAMASRTDSEPISSTRRFIFPMRRILMG